MIYVKEGVRIGHITRHFDSGIVTIGPVKKSKIAK
jgi:hypothetical protein